MNIILASVRCLPKLIEGKVAVINDDDTYTLYRPSRYCKSIKDNYDPLDFSILNNDQWRIYNLLINSTRWEREQFLVNEQFNKFKEMWYPQYRIGDKIHIFSRQGIYEIVDITANAITITCKVWQYDKFSRRTISKSDFKCLAGGKHNHNHEY